MNFPLIAIAFVGSVVLIILLLRTLSALRCPSEMDIKKALVDLQKYPEWQTPNELNMGLRRKKIRVSSSKCLMCLYDLVEARLSECTTRDLKKPVKFRSAPNHAVWKFSSLAPAEFILVAQQAVTIFALKVAIPASPANENGLRDKYIENLDLNGLQSFTMPEVINSIISIEVKPQKICFYSHIRWST